MSDDLPVNLRKTIALNKIIADIRGAAWDDIGKLWTDSMNELAITEPRFTGNIMTATSPVQLELGFPSNTLLRSIVASAPFEGKTLKQWVSNLRASDIRRIEDQIKIGLVQGQTGPTIARSVVGTTGVGGVNGITNITRNNAAAITRTATIAISNFGRREFFRSNAGIMTGELYVATLDSRTTAICRALDGQLFPVAEGPIPPLHINCRSVRVAVFDNEVLGRRPANPSTERQLLKEFTDNRNLKRVTTRSALPRGTKGAFDKFSRRRIREIVGTVPAKVSYQVWLGRQSVPFQNEVLGETKGILFRKGGIQLDRFVNRVGDEKTLAELAVSDKQAFIAAGLDPTQF